MSVLVFDIGGTNIRIALSSNGRTLNVVRHFRTPRTWPAARRLIIDFVKRCAPSKIHRVVGGVPGMLDAKHAALRVAFCLPRWEGRPIRRDLASAFRAPVRLENDCVLGALGEAHAGAGRGYRSVGYLAVGTGIGGAKVVRGKIDEHADGFEPGHQIVNGRKTFSDLVGGTSIKRRWRRDPAAIRSPAVWRRIGRDFAVGIRNATMFWSPEVMILSGSVVSRQPVMVREARIRASRALRRFGYRVKIVRGRLGDRAGLYGALTLAKKRA
ncbi:MAG: ROK family protein [Patescibacteria group bacterium]